MSFVTWAWTDIWNERRAPSYSLAVILLTCPLQSVCPCPDLAGPQISFCQVATVWLWSYKSTHYNQVACVLTWWAPQKSFSEVVNLQIFFHGIMNLGCNLCYRYRDHFLNAPNQWETLYFNIVSYWLCAFTEWSLEILDEGSASSLLSNQMDGLVQGRNSIANALELHLSCTNPLIWFLT